MPGSTQVTRLRVSRLAGRVHDRLAVLGEPVAFADHLASPAPVRGVAVELPFGDGLPVDTDFWARIVETPLTVPVDQQTAPKLRRAFVPLRCAGRLDAAAQTPRLEAHVHPFGVVAMSTVDLVFTEPVAIEDAAARVVELEQRTATVELAGGRRDTTLALGATTAAELLVSALSDQGVGQSWAAPSHRLVTVISGIGQTSPTAMPTANSQLHRAMHELSAGQDVLAAPPSAFVPLWSGAGYVWSPTRLIYMLAQGTSLLSAESLRPDAGPQAGSAGDRHRWLLLLEAYLIAVVGLVRATGSSSINFPVWADTAAKRLGLLFGPGRSYLDWGLAPHALLDRVGADQDVARISGTQLTHNANYPIPAFG